jgi:hypothetical protein
MQTVFILYLYIKNQYHISLLSSIYIIFISCELKEGARGSVVGSYKPEDRGFDSQ